MTTLIVRVPPALAIRVARAADREAVSHEDLLVTALRSFLGAYESIQPDGGGTKPTSKKRRRLT